MTFVDKAMCVGFCFVGSAVATYFAANPLAWWFVMLNPRPENLNIRESMTADQAQYIQVEILRVVTAAIGGFVCAALGAYFLRNRTAVR